MNAVICEPVDEPLREKLSMLMLNDPAGRVIDCVPEVKPKRTPPVFSPLTSPISAAVKEALAAPGDVKLTTSEKDAPL
jgi:hypothetical protein